MTKDPINRIYNLILNPDISPKERELLVLAKESLAESKDTSRVLMALAEDFRRLAVSGILSNQTLSPAVADFYRDISTLGLKDKELAKGLISMGVWLKH